MRITCDSLNAFASNLLGVRVFRGVVYYERNEEPLNGTKRDATSFEVTYTLTTVLDFDDDGLALLTCGIDCGIDRRTADGEKEGIQKMEGIHEDVKRLCESNGWTLKPGLLDM